MFRNVFVTCLLMAGALTASAQDKITMTSGAVHQGAIVKVDATTLTLRMSAGDIAFQRKDILWDKVEIQKPADLETAFKTVEAKKYADAIPYLKAVTDKYLNLPIPWVQQAWATLADAQAANNQWPAAIETYKKLLALFPQTPFALKAKIGLSQGLISEKKYDEALRLLEPAVEPLRKELTVSANDNFFLGTAMIVLGDCYQAQGDLPKALDAYLSTVVLYYRDPHAVQQAQQKANAIKEKLKT